MTDRRAGVVERTLFASREAHGVRGIRCAGYLYACCMTGLWSWVFGLASIAGAVLSVILGIRTFVSADFPTFAFGLVVGVTIGAIACTVVGFKRPRPEQGNQVGSADEVARLGKEIRELERDVTEAAAQMRIKGEQADADEQAGLAGRARTFRSQTVQWAKAHDTAIVELQSKQLELEDAQRQGQAPLAPATPPSTESTASEADATRHHARRPALWAAAFVGSVGFVAFVVGLSVFTSNKTLSYAVGPTGLILLSIAAVIAIVSWIAQFARWAASRRSVKAIPGGARPDPQSDV